MVNNSVPGSEGILNSGVGDGTDAAVSSNGVSVGKGGIVGSGVGSAVTSSEVTVGAEDGGGVSTKVVSLGGISARLTVSAGNVTSLTQPINQIPSNPINQICLMFCALFIYMTCWHLAIEYRIKK
jgi:hypothetical protein